MSQHERMNEMRSKALLLLGGVAVLILATIMTTSADVSHDPNTPILIDHDRSYDFSVLGSRAGAFAYFSIEYPGDASVITMELDMAPGDPAAQLGLGFNVYARNGYLIGSARRSEDKVDRKVLMWADRNPSPWLIQVYNYLEGVPVGFHLQVTGLPLPAPTPLPVMEPSQAVEFSAVTDAIIGSRAGNFRYYKVESAGDGSEVVLQLYHDPDNRWVANAFGINVYAPIDGLLVAQGRHEVSFKLEYAGTYLLQVYNYLDGALVHYSLDMAGP